MQPDDLTGYGNMSLHELRKAQRDAALSRETWKLFKILSEFVDGFETSPMKIVGETDTKSPGPGPRVMAASTLEGDDVINRTGEKLGTIQEIMLDVPSGRIAYAVLSHGGLLGVGDRLFAIPWRALTLDTENKCFILDVAKERLSIAPGFDKDHWPAMADGVESPATNAALDAVYADLLRFQPADDRARVMMAEVLYQLDQLTQARRARLALASGIVPGILWAVLFLGAALTIGFTFFFGTENLGAQALMTGALALLIFAGLLIIVAIDRPFSGTVTVRPEALAAALADFGEAKGAE